MQIIFIGLHVYTLVLHLTTLKTQNNRSLDTFEFDMSVLSDILELAFIAPETKRVLERLSHMPDVNVTIISGREMNDLRKKVSDKHLYCQSCIYWENILI